MATETQIHAYPEVTLAHVPCPIEACDQRIEIRGKLLVETGQEDEETALYRLGSEIDTSPIEIHMVEHGLDPVGEDVE